MNTSLDWGKYNQPTYGSDKIRPVRFISSPWPRPKRYNSKVDYAVAPPGTFLNPRFPKPSPIKPKPKPDTTKPPISKDWYNLK